MATPLSPEELAIFRDHINRFPASATCPVCGNKAWTIAGVEASSNVVGLSTTLEGAVMATLSVVCDRCFYIRQYAWGPISRGAPKDGVPPVGGSNV